MNLIETRNLSLTIRDRPILRDVSMTLGEGDFKLIIGPNGAGKSTLVKCILSLRTDYSGEVLIQGEPGDRMQENKRARLIGYVPQSLDMQFNMDVNTFVELARFAYEETARERAGVVLESLRRTRVEHLRYAFLDELSGGERQRVLVAAALAQQPRVLILDEPESSLDPHHRVEMVQLLDRLHREEGLSLLLVTHDWNQFYHKDARVFALKEGAPAFRCGVKDLKDHLGALYDCSFHHLKVGDDLVSIPRYNDPPGV